MSPVRAEGQLRSQEMDRARSLDALCDSCPLSSGSGGPVFPEARPGALLIVVGESPGDTEFEKGFPFAGPSGRLLNKAILRAGGSREYCHITNATLCDLRGLPPGTCNNALQCCRPRLIAELETCKSKHILALGDRALQTLTGLRGIFKWIGGPVKGCEPFCSFTIIPALHPAFILRPEGSANIFTFLEHVRSAWRLASGEPPDTWGKITLEPGKQALKQLRKMRSERLPIAIDVETRGVDPMTSLTMCVGVGNTRRAVSLPWEEFDTVKYGTSPALEALPFGNQCKNLVIQIIESNLPKALQNGSHDILNLERLGIHMHNYACDTLLDHVLTSPGTRHDLGYQLCQETTLERYKTIFKAAAREKGTAVYVRRDPLELRAYNAKDVIGTAILARENCERLRKVHNGELLSQKALSLTKLALKMRRAGIGIDRARLDYFDRILKRRKLRAKYELRLFCEQIGFIKVAPEDARQMGWLRWHLKAHRRDKSKIRALRERQAKYAFNINSGPLMKRLFFTFLNQRAKAFSRKTRLASLDERTLVDYVTCATDVRARTAARILLRFRRWQKLHSTYVTGLKELITSKGTVHATPNVMGAKTFRWSYQDPNLQNIPRPVERVTKNGQVVTVTPSLHDVFVDPEDGWIAKGDYNQLELRIAAQRAGDEPLLETFSQNEDPHAAFAFNVFGLRRGDFGWLESMRTISKIAVYLLIYGGQAESLYRALVVKFPNTLLSRCYAIKNIWEKTHPALGRRRQADLKFARQHGYIEAPLSGHRIYFFDNNIEETKVYNWPVQHTAADIINETIHKVADVLDWKKHFLWAQIHDELCVRGPSPGVLFQALKNMETEITLNGVTMKYPIDIKLGKSWGDCTKVKSEDEAQMLKESYDYHLLSSSRY